MLSLSSLIEFLLDMLRDPATQHDFARDPTAALAARGLSAVTAQDIQDVQPMLVDHTGVSASVAGAHAAPVDHGYHPHGYQVDGPAPSPVHHLVAQDPLPAIQHVANTYEVDRTMVVRNVTQEYKQYATYKTYLSDHSIHAENGGTVIQDSFNTENAGVDLRGAHVDNSVIAGHDANGSGNDVDTTTTQGSNNDDHATTAVASHDHVATQDYANVGNDSSSHHDAHDGADPHDGADAHDDTTASHAGHSDPNGSYEAHAASATSPVDDGADLAHHG